MAATTIGRAAALAAINAFSDLADAANEADRLTVGPDDEPNPELEAGAELVLTVMKAAGVFDTYAVPQYDDADIDIVRIAYHVLTDWGYCLG